MVAPSPPRPPALTEAGVSAELAKGPHDFVDVGHSRLAHWRFGHGPDVVLVHGWPLHAATFRRVIPRLAGELTLHALDLPGAGRTESEVGVPCDWSAQADALRRAVDVLGLSRFALLAHDSGGAIARIAAAGDARVRAIALGNTEIPGQDVRRIRALVRLARVPGALGALFRLMRLRFARRAMLGNCFADPASVEGEFTELFLRPLFSSRAARSGPVRFLRSIDAGAIERLSEVHARIAAPVLCIWGARDPWFPVARARAMLPQFAGGAELVEIVRGRTFVHEDRPEEFAAAAGPFLRRHLAGS